MKAGTFLKAVAEGNEFDDTLIFITEWNSQGATGFIVNKPFNRSLNELEEFKNAEPFPLHTGGPVMPQKLYFAHCCPHLIEGGIPIAGDIRLGGNFTQALALINNTTIHQDDIRLFIGYCGWEAGQLEEEIRQGSWETIEGPLSMLFI